MNRIAVALTGLALAAGPAVADTGATQANPTVPDAASLAEQGYVFFPAGDRPGDAVKIVPPVKSDDSSEATISPIIFLNRCVGGCTITSSSVDNAATQESTIPTQSIGTKITIPAFAWDDATWTTFVQCVKEIYSPYAVQITDVDPGPTVVHHEIIVAGGPADLGLPNNVGGIAPINGDRSPKNNNISFAFASVWPPSQVLELCATAGQESAHSWGLDHEFSCTDPMTYLNPCGGQKFFRNKDYPCGMYTVAPACDFGGQGQSSGQTQNSHTWILGVFGAGTSIVPAPTVQIASPKNGDTVTNGWTTFATTAGKRGTYKVQLILNGYVWAEVDPTDDPGSGTVAPIYSGGPYQLKAPATVPNGVIDVDVKACDDLGLCTDQKITVNKGSPCADAAKDCLTGQKCDAGKCYWDPATGNVGDKCTYPQSCLSGLCVGTGGADMFCTQKCFVGIAGQCPDAFECDQDSTGQGYCLPMAAPAPTGCCSAGDDGPASTVAHVGLAGLVVGFAFARRRRRA